MISIQSNKIGKRLIVLLLITLMLLSVTLSGVAGGILKAAADQSYPIPAVSDVDATAMPNVLVIGTGGTISGQANNNDPTNLQSYRSGTYLIKDMVEQLPRKDKIADVNTYQFGNKGSGSYTVSDLYDLSLTVDQALKTYDGVVVTTGTDTMEDIAYFLDLTVQSEKPVVVTGAMRPWDVIGTDAPANLYNAIKLAGSGKTKWFGTVIMLNDIIQAAREVTKSNAHRLDTFSTPVVGALGYIDQDNIRVYRLNDRAMKAGQPGWATPFDFKLINKANLPIVELAYAYQDASGAAINGLVADGTQGIVTAGTGAGGISSKMSTARTEAIKKGVIFVTTTRTGSGTMYPSNSNGIIAGDNLNPQHARIMLFVAMAFSKDFTTVQSWFETYGTHNIDLDRQAPAWPSESKLAATSIGQTGITMQWPQLEGENKASYYRLYVNNETLPLITLKGSESSFTATGLSSNTSYQFKIKAVDQAGNESTEMVLRSTTASSGPSPLIPGTATPTPIPTTLSSRNIPAGSMEQITLNGEITVTIPAGATDKAMKIIIEKLTDISSLIMNDNKLLSSVTEITKDITGNFIKPVTLTFKFDPSNIGEGKVPSVFYYDEAKKEWIEIGGKVNGEYISAESNHFTKFAVFAANPKPDITTPALSLLDITGHWAEAAIKTAVAAGVVSGYPDGTFKPEQSVTRAEFVVLLMKSLKLQEMGTAPNFIDKDRIGTWALSAISQAVKAGIISGYPDNSFRPNAIITRSEMTAIIANALKLNIDVKAVTGFVDDSAIPGWAKGAVKAVKDSAIIQGRDGNKFAPNDASTRAEAVTIIVKLSSMPKS